MLGVTEVAAGAGMAVAMAAKATTRREKSMMVDVYKSESYVRFKGKVVNIVERGRRK